MRLYYTDAFVLPLPEGHRFPMRKYSLLREYLLASGEFSEADFLTPPVATDEELCRAHTPDYIRRMTRGEVSAAELRSIGFPWSPEMIERSRRSAGATLAACRAALEDGCAVNLAGGTHHAQADGGEGFCVFNDAAVAALAMIAEGRAEQVAVVDCDVHQGNGTAAILRDNGRVFTFSIHGARNFPFEKGTSDLDIGLPDGTGDADYLAALNRGLAETFVRSTPRLVIYLAGADPYVGDRLGRLSLSREGLRERDRRVLAACCEREISVAVAMAGGYAEPIEDTARIHAATVQTARCLFFG